MDTIQRMVNSTNPPSYYMPKGTEDFAALQNIKTQLGLAVLVAILSVHVADVFARFSKNKSPFVGVGWSFEPRMITAHRYVREAERVLNEGYNKFHGFFWVARHEMDMLLVSNHYADEMRSMPQDKLSSFEATAQNIFAKYSLPSYYKLDPTFRVRFIDRYMTAQLHTQTPAMVEEMDLAMEKVMPKCENDWVEYKTLDTNSYIIARVINRLLIGLPKCRDEAWLDLALRYTKSLFGVIVVMRCLPPFLHPIAGWLAPPTWKASNAVKEAQVMMKPLIQHHRERNASPAEMNGLDWIVQNASIEERNDDDVAIDLITLNLASVRTLGTLITNTLHELCIRPQYFDPLRQEIEENLKLSADQIKPALVRMQKLDSFMLESLSLNPGAMTTFHRVVKVPITLSNGRQLTPGTHLAAPTLAMVQEAQGTGEDGFDGFRNWKKRQEPGQQHKNVLSRTDKDHMGFGLGPGACPGRFWAAHFGKIFMCRLLLKYEFKFVDGKGRPQPLKIDRWVFPDPNGKLMIRERKKASA